MPANQLPTWAQSPAESIPGMAPVASHSSIPPDWIRPDGTPKGAGFFGALRLSNGGVASEFSIADSEHLKDDKGNYLDYPSLVPTLTKPEVQAVLQSAASNGRIPLPDSVYEKAEAHALQRRREGKPLFAQPGEEQNIYPDLERAPLPNFVPKIAPETFKMLASHKQSK